MDAAIIVLIDAWTICQKENLFSERDEHLSLFMREFIRFVVFLSHYISANIHIVEKKLMI